MSMIATTANPGGDRPCLPIDFAIAPKPAACYCRACAPNGHDWGHLADVLAWLADDEGNTVEDYPGEGWQAHSDPEGWPDWTDEHVWSPADE